MQIELKNPVLTCKKCGAILSYPMQHAVTCNPDPCEPESLEDYAARGGDVSKLETFDPNRPVRQGVRTIHQVPPIPGVRPGQKFLPGPIPVGDLVRHQRGVYTVIGIREDGWVELDRVLEIGHTGLERMEHANEQARNPSN